MFLTCLLLLLLLSSSFDDRSSIEYTVHRDQRFASLAKRALITASLIISGSVEVAERIDKLYPGEQDLLTTLKKKRRIVGVGTDTCASLFFSNE